MLNYMGGCLVAKSCPTLETPWTVAHQTPLSMGFSRQDYWSGLPFPSPGDLLGIRSMSNKYSVVSRNDAKFLEVWYVQIE